MILYQYDIFSWPARGRNLLGELPGFATSFQLVRLVGCGLKYNTLEVQRSLRYCALVCSVITTVSRSVPQRFQLMFCRNLRYPLTVCIR